MLRGVSGCRDPEASARSDSKTPVAGESGKEGSFLISADDWDVDLVIVCIPKS